MVLDGVCSLGDLPQRLLYNVNAQMIVMKPRSEKSAEDFESK